MILENSITTVGPPVDERLKERVIILATTEISKRMRGLIGLGIYAVAEQLERDDKLDEYTDVNCIISEYGEISLNLSEEQMGNVFTAISYPIKKWSDAKLNEVKILTSVIEELAHFFWNIKDEVEVSYKVLQVINIVQPHLTLQDLFNIEWLNNYESK